MCHGIISGFIIVHSNNCIARDFGGLKMWWSTNLYMSAILTLVKFFSTCMISIIDMQQLARMCMIYLLTIQVCYSGTCFQWLTMQDQVHLLVCYEHCEHLWYMHNLLFSSYRSHFNNKYFYLCWGCFGLFDRYSYSCLSAWVAQQKFTKWDNV